MPTQSSTEISAPPRFGLFYLPVLGLGTTDTAAGSLAAIERQVCYADQHGWSQVWLAEHHGARYGGIISAPEVFGAYLAARTAQIRIGPAICVLPLHDPRHLAERYALLDQLSKGRLEMGIGHGFLAHEFELFGIDRAESRERFKEALEVIVTAWKQGWITFSGKFYRYEAAEVYPECVQSPPPIWVAASRTRESFETAGRHGYHLMINPYTRTPEEVSEGLTTYFAAREEVGLPKHGARITAVQHLFCGEIDTALVAEFNSYLQALAEAANSTSRRGDAASQAKHFEALSFDKVYPQKVLFGRSEDLAERIDKWRRLGVTDFCLMPQFGCMSWERSLESLQRFTEEVVMAQRSQISETPFKENARVSGVAS